VHFIPSFSYEPSAFRSHFNGTAQASGSRQASEIFAKSLVLSRVAKGEPLKEVNLGNRPTNLGRGTRSTDTFNEPTYREEARSAGITPLR
jgi:hypothetical protein